MLYKPGWSQTQRSAYPQRPGVKGMHHHAYPDDLYLKLAFKFMIRLPQLWVAGITKDTLDSCVSCMLQNVIPTLVTLGDDGAFKKGGTSKPTFSRFHLASGIIVVYL